MSSFVPLLTGFLTRRRQTTDLKGTQAFDISKALQVQTLKNEGDLEEQALSNKATLSKAVLDNYMDNNKDYLTFGGSDMTKKLLGLICLPCLALPVRFLRTRDII